MHLTQRRRGRPRHDHPEVDKGTKELQQKRKMLLEKSQMQDPFLAGSLLGVLYAHEVISKPLYEAGRFFGELGYRYAPCLGYTFRRHASVSKLIGPSLGSETSLSEMQDEKLTQAWRKALRALQQVGYRPYKIVLRVVFYDQDLYTSGLPRYFLKEVEPLRQGLECLEFYFRGALKDRRDKLCDQVLNPRRSTMSQQPLRELLPPDLP